ncbi:MAG: DUF1801 domain-containing protein [Cyclobacteriaceae bacterium]
MMNKNSIVDDYLNEKNHPLNDEIQRVREIILSTDPAVEETIKWQSPTFMYKGNIASYFMNSKKHVSLMFHKGAMINDPSGLLQGDGKEARTAKFASLEEIESCKSNLQAVVKEWIRIQDEK